MGVWHVSCHLRRLAWWQFEITPNRLRQDCRLAERHKRARVYGLEHWGIFKRLTFPLSAVLDSQKRHDDELMALRSVLGRLGAGTTRDRRWYSLPPDSCAEMAGCSWSCGNIRSTRAVIRSVMLFSSAKKSAACTSIQLFAKHMSQSPYHRHSVVAFAWVTVEQADTTGTKPSTSILYRSQWKRAESRWDLAIFARSLLGTVICEVRKWSLCQRAVQTLHPAVYQTMPSCMDAPSSLPAAPEQRNQQLTCRLLL